MDIYLIVFLVLLIIGLSVITYNMTIKDKFTVSPINDFTINGNTIMEYIGSSNIVSIPNDINEISDGSFYRNKNIQEITLNNVKTIARGEFDSCTNLTKINFSNMLTIIDTKTFTNCTGLTNIIFPEGLIQINNQAFSNCSNLTKIVLPSTLKQLGPSIFAACNKLTDIILKGDVNDILLEQGYSGAYPFFIKNYGDNSETIYTINVYSSITWSDDRKNKFKSFTFPDIIINFLNTSQVVVVSGINLPSTQTKNKSYNLLQTKYSTVYKFNNPIFISKNITSYNLITIAFTISNITQSQSSIFFGKGLFIDKNNIIRYPDVQFFCSTSNKCGILRYNNNQSETYLSTTTLSPKKTYDIKIEFSNFEKDISDNKKGCSLNMTAIDKSDTTKTPITLLTNQDTSYDNIITINNIVFYNGIPNQMTFSDVSFTKF